ncbi:unnamed protein product, partial [Urochloa humidicola]
THTETTRRPSLPLSHRRTGSNARATEPGGVPDRARGEVDPGAGSSSPPPPMDLGLGGAGRAGSGGGGARGMSGSGSGGGGSGRNSSFALGGGGASAAAWTRLASSGVEDDLVAASGGGGGRVAGAGAGGLPQGHFLEACFLCRKPLASNRDIFMYRGDIPFCTEECRMEQIEMDEEMERKESGTQKKVAARAPSHAGVESPPRPPKARAGSILAG